MGLRVLIVYHSASGNTQWVAGQLARALVKLRGEVEVRSTAHQPTPPDISSYDLVGFGCPVMGFRPTPAMTGFIESIPPQCNVPSFIFMTYAGILANAPWMLARSLQSRGFVVAAHTHFRSEVSWPVARVFGLRGNRGLPDERSLPSVLHFAEGLAALCGGGAPRGVPSKAVIPFSVLNPFYYLSILSNGRRLRVMMVTKRVDKGKCTQCGWCEKFCGSRAVSLNPYPQFTERCTGCWGCYKICPEGAISAIVGTKGRYRAKASMFGTHGKRSEKWVSEMFP